MKEKNNYKVLKTFKLTDVKSSLLLNELSIISNEENSILSIILKRGDDYDFNEKFHFNTEEYGCTDIKTLLFILNRNRKFINDETFKEITEFINQIKF